MKLLQINDKEWINPDLIMTIEEDPVDNSFCFIQLLYGYKRFCDRYSAQQLMSKICENTYYDWEEAKQRLKDTKITLESFKEAFNNENDGICKEDK